MDGRTDGRTEGRRYLASAAAGGTRNAALRWKRRFLLSVSFSFSLSVVSGRMEDEIASETTRRGGVYLASAAGHSVLCSGSCPPPSSSSVPHSLLFRREKKLAGRKKYPKSIFTLLAPRIYAITFARQVRNELVEVYQDHGHVSWFFHHVHL